MVEHTTDLIGGFDSTRVDRRLNAAIGLLVAALLVLGGLFGYEVYSTEQEKALANAPMRMIVALERQVRANPNDAMLRVRLGEAYGAARRFPDAIEQFKAALKIEPNHVGAYLDLGMVAMLTGRDAEAEGYFKKVIELTESAQFSQVDKRRELALYNLGRMKLVQEKYAEAAGYFKAALRIRKDASDTYLSLARALKGLGDYDGAIEQAEYALAFDPGFAEAHFTMGELYELKGDKVKASYHFAEAARLAPDAEPPQERLAAFGPASDWVARARAALGKGATDEAIDAARIARNLDPKALDAALVHAEALSAAGKHGAALRAALDAVTIAPGSARAAELIDRLEQERPKEALRLYREALKKRPDDEALKRRIETLQKRLR